MKPYGIGGRIMYFHSKVDHHIKGFKNWWEERHPIIKNRERQKAKKIIQQELNEALLKEKNT